MSLPFSYIVPITAVVQSPAFVLEKKHMLLAMVTDIIPSGTPYIEFGGAGALSAFGKMFGKAIPEYTQVQKYFSFLSKIGTTPEKLIVARWYKTAAAPFVQGKAPTALGTLEGISNGSIKITFGADTEEITGLDFTGATSYSDIASVLQAGIRAASLETAFTGATVEFSSLARAFIITSGDNGSEATIGAPTAGSTGTDVRDDLGFAGTGVVLSQGVDAETWTEFCDRIYYANSAGYSITTLETLTVDDIQDSVAWLQSVIGEQNYNTMVRLVFNMTDKADAIVLQTTLAGLGYTGYVITYDPNGEFVNILDCAICAAIDFERANGAINFNFQPAIGYTPITTLGSVVDYQQGKTNVALVDELLAANISFVYSLGFGNQTTNYYGFGLMNGDFGTEDIQVNESWLERNLQTDIINALDTLNKLKMQGDDARILVSSVITPSFELGKTNGVIARNGTLSQTDRISIYQATNNAGAADCVEQNGYYYQVEPITATDIEQRRIRVIACYLAAGVVNKIRITNNIYGA